MFLVQCYGSGSGWPKKDRIRPDTDLDPYLNIFLMFRKIIICYGVFLPNLNIFWKSKIKKLFERNCTILYNEKNLNSCLFVDKASGSGIFPDPDPGDPKRPDPTLDFLQVLKHKLPNGTTNMTTAQSPCFIPDLKSKFLFIFLLSISLYLFPPLY